LLSVQRTTLAEWLWRNLRCRWLQHYVGLIPPPPPPGYRQSQRPENPVPTGVEGLSVFLAEGETGTQR